MNCSTPVRAALLLLALGMPLISVAQENDTTLTATEQPDTDIAEEETFPVMVAPKKHFWRASGELFLTELIPWSYNYFIRDADFAHISFSSIGHNLKPSSWEWDDNNFKTNQFAHPYHGNLYFNTFRTNGYSFWQSVPAAFAGSFIWEIAGETHNPAPNDLINTSLGGIALGEMTYRISSLIIKNRKRGFGRQVQEGLALLVNPVNGFNRIVDGKWGKVEAYDPEDSIYMNIAVDAGYRRVGLSAKKLFSEGDNEFYGSVGLWYGDPFKNYKKPFDNFYVFLEVGSSDSAKLNTLRVEGSLAGKIIGGGEHSLHMLRFTMNYDYYHNTAFEFGGQSVTLSWAAHYGLSRKASLNTELGLGAIILGAVPDHYLYYGEGRNYDYGPGCSYTSAVYFNYANTLYASAAYRGGFTWTVNGNDSHYWLQGFTSEVRYVFFRNFSLSGAFGDFRLQGNYKDYEDTRDKFPYLKLSAGYKLIF